MSKIYEDLDKTVGLVKIERLGTRIKNLVAQFKNDSEEYFKIKKDC